MLIFLMALFMATAPVSSLGPFPVPTADVAFSLGADLNGWVGGSGGRNPTLSVDPGDNVTVTIVWVNSLHDWALYPGGTLPADVDPGSPNAIFRTADVSSASSTANVTFTLSTPGRYEYYCEYHPFSMHGQLIVQGPNSPPTLGAIGISTARIVVGQIVTLTATASDPEADILSFAWDFGDGTNATGMTAAGGGTISATHAYAKVGTYLVTLLVDDGRDGQTSASTTVTVEAPAGVPGLLLVLIAGVGVAAVLTGLALTLWARRRRKGKEGRP